MATKAVLKQPNLQIIAKGIDKRASQALKALERASKGKYAERTGVSERTLNRLNTR